jgi:hypothetical protein
VAAAAITLWLGVFTASRTARAAATVRQGLERVATAAALIPLRRPRATPSAPLLAPSLPRTLGLRWAPAR